MARKAVEPLEDEYEDPSAPPDNSQFERPGPERAAPRHGGVFPPPRPNLGYQMPPKEAARVGGTPAMRIRVADIVARQERMKDNPFARMSHDPAGLPSIPEGEGFAYLWARANLAGEIDAQRLGHLTTGYLRYEFVRLEDLPEDVQPLVDQMRIKSGELAGCIGIDDVVLMRVPIEMRDYMIDVREAAADKMISRIIPQAEEALAGSGAEPAGSQFHRGNDRW